MSKKFLSLFLAVAMLVQSVPAFAEETTSTPLVVGYSDFSEKFSPFYAESGYDTDVAGMTQLSLMTTDRMGGIIYNAIEGETVPYNGTDYTYKGIADLKVEYKEDEDKTYYTAKIRDDIVFSDGVAMTADDIIFTYYVYLDPGYIGSSTLNTYDIVGLKDYLTQTTSDIYDKYYAIAVAIYEAGVDHEWSESDSWTKEQQDAFWAAIEAGWKADVQGTIDYVATNYLSYAPDYIGYEAEDVVASDDLKVVLGMVMWGFGTVEEGVLTGAVTGTTWDLTKEEYPTVDDYYAETYAAYEGDVVAYAGTESANGTDVQGNVIDAFISENAASEPELEGGIPNISGITKLDDYTVQIVTNGYSAPAVYSILGISVTPMHYYGDPAQYDYENNQFGHPYGDLSIVESKTTVPVGAGAYKFVKYENRVVYFEANENYYKGEPKTKYIQFKETDTSEVGPGVQSGTIDAGELNGSKANFEALAGYNSNGEITGDVITTSKVDNLGYGYLGINALTVKVGDDPASEESKNVRRALATVLAVYRDVAIDSYYGEAASIINYPISNTSWAAPQPTDDDYKVAFSVDVDGNDIYTSDMLAEDKYAAALQAAVGFLKAAGYTFDDATGKFTAAPEGASLSYEVIIPAEGKGDHPSFGILTDAAKALETIGITLKINDPADSNVLWDALDADTQELWCAAWSSTIDPDMYQVYHSSSTVTGSGASTSNHYNIIDDELDNLIVTARESDDQAYRKALYKSALDIIVDWAVEVPVYQRQNCIIFSTERINMDTITPDITTFWGWMNDIELIEMK